MSSVPILVENMLAKWIRNDTAKLQYLRFIKNKLATAKLRCLIESMKYLKVKCLMLPSSPNGSVSPNNNFRKTLTSSHIRGTLPTYESHVWLSEGAAGPTGQLVTCAASCVIYGTSTRKHKLRPRQRPAGSQPSVSFPHRPGLDAIMCVNCVRRASGRTGRSR